MLFSVHVWKSALVCGPHPRSLSGSWQQIRCSTQSDKSDRARLLPCPVADEYVYWNTLWRLLTLMLLLPSLSWSLFRESFVHGTWTELNSSSEHVVFQWKCLQYTNWTELDWSLQTIVLNTCFPVRVLTLHGLNWTKLTLTCNIHWSQLVGCNKVGRLMLSVTTEHVHTKPKMFRSN